LSCNFEPASLFSLDNHFYVPNKMFAPSRMGSENPLFHLEVNPRKELLSIGLKFNIVRSQRGLRSWN